MIDSTQFIFNLQSLLKNNLPGDKAHQLLSPIKRKSANQAIDSNMKFRFSAVGVILYPEKNSIRSILIQRPKYEGTHGGQISFPGGKMDEHDFDLEFTARRECFEEINLPIETGKHVGELSKVYIPVSEFIVQPHIFYVEKLPELIPDAREVEDIISFDLFHLKNESIIKKKDIKLGNGFKRKDVPYFDIDGNIVWGATAMMLSEIKTLLHLMD